MIVASLRLVTHVLFRVGDVERNVNDSGDQGSGHEDRNGERGDDQLSEDHARGPIDETIEPGDPSSENVAFVLLGVLAALYVLARIAGLV